MLENLGIQQNPCLNFPHIKIVLSNITQNDDGDYIYQGIKLMYFEHSKNLIKNNTINYVESVIIVFRRKIW